MKRVLTSAEVQALEARAAARPGGSFEELMERAGTALAETALAEAAADGRFFVLCGPGNNGGDGFVAARHLLRWGRSVRLCQVGGTNRLSPDAQAKRSAVALPFEPLPAPGEVTPGDVLVDALFGTGLRRAPEGAFADAIARIGALRGAGARVVSADVPSGLPSDGQGALRPCVTADVTVTFGALKVGQVMAEGVERCGVVQLVDIGLPPEAEWGSGSAVRLVEEQDAALRLAPRPLDSHKGTFGHVLVLAGSTGKTGAASLCAEASLRAGAGLCTLAARAESLRDAQSRVPEAMGLPLPGEGALSLRDLPVLRDALQGKRSWVAGPGIPRGEETGELLFALLSERRIPAVLDADALNALAGAVERLAALGADIVLTPHPGEAARLLGWDGAAVQADRLGAARALAERTGAVVVLKGARSLIAQPGGDVFVNPTGNPGMATGGTGDVLAGVVGGLLAQGLSPLDAALVAAYAHGLAGDLAAAERGQLGLLARDVLAALGDVWRRWRR